MTIKANSKTVVVFDLDDTLYDEIDFLYSGFKSIAGYFFSISAEKTFKKMLHWYYAGENVFQNLIKGEVFLESDITFNVLLDHYRNHFPSIKLRIGAKQLLNNIRSNGCKTGIITDGRSITQNNKILALGLENLFDLVVISEEFGSEKPNIKNYLVFQEKFKDCRFYYIADNPIKDFISPNLLGWETICIRDKGKNIHPQNFDLDSKYLPKNIVKNFNDIVIAPH